MWPPSRSPGGSALPTAPHLLKRSLAAKDTHVCIKLLGSQSNSGTSDSNYRCITGADKSAARQPGTCQCSTADAVRGAERGEGLRAAPTHPRGGSGLPWAPPPHHGPPVPNHPGVSTPRPCSEAAPAPAGLGTRLSLGRHQLLPQPPTALPLQPLGRAGAQNSSWEPAGSMLSLA